LSTVSAISWQSGSVAHHALYAIGQGDDVYVSVDGGGYTALGGYAKQISAGLDALGNPVVYAIGQNDGLYVNTTGTPGFTALGGYVKQISGSTNGRVYAIGAGNDVYLYNGSFIALGGYAQQISAGLDGSNQVVYAIGADNGLFVNTTGTPGFTLLGGYVKQISGTENGAVYAIGQGDDVYYRNLADPSFTPLGGYAKQISASLSGLGISEVFVIGKDNSVYVNHRDGLGFVSLGPSYARQISAPAFDVGLANDVVYAVGSDHEGFLHDANGWNSLGGYLQGSGGAAGSGAAEEQNISDPMRDKLSALAAWSSQSDATDELSLACLVTRSNLRMHDEVFAVAEYDLSGAIL
jgi:hypothetical protein